jgi:methionyl-tRNA formyltransferase
MGGAFSAIPMKSLLEQHIDVCAVVTPGLAPSPSDWSGRMYIPLAGASRAPETIASLAREHAIPVEYVRQLNAAPTLARLAAYRPDVILVACFPYVFPPALLQIPRLGCLNLHPSLLPAYRGPAPLFWQFRQGERQTGVTLHVVDERLDAGDILLQASVPLRDGLTGPEAEALLAEQGGQLMLEALDLLGQDALTPRKQDESGSSYFPWPAEQDFQISTQWPAQRAFNFIRGTQEWGCAYEIVIERQRFPVHRAVSYSAHQELDNPYVLIGRELWVQFVPGVLRAVVAQP